MLRRQRLVLVSTRANPHSSIERFSLVNRVSQDATRRRADGAGLVSTHKRYRAPERRERESGEREIFLTPGAQW